MREWLLTCSVFLLWLQPYVLTLLPGKNVLKILPEILGLPAANLTEATSAPFTTSVLTSSSGTRLWLTGKTTVAPYTTSVLTASSGTRLWRTEMTTVAAQDYDGPDPPSQYPMQYAGVPQEMAVYPLSLPESDHELMLNVSWTPSSDFPATDYSLEVRCLTDTVDCKTALMCYEYNIPGDSHWWLIPAYANPVAESCAIRPGCTYAVFLTAHPWDGHTVTEKIIQLDECVDGVCSCAHSPRLPAPLVTAATAVVQGDIFVNVSWSLPKPQYPQRLPRNLNKHTYVVSISKQMVTDAHPAPWFAKTVLRHVNANGPVSIGDSVHWLLLPVSERSEPSERSRGRLGQNSYKLQLDVKLLARVNLVDDRGCVGPAGNATAYDPAIARKVKFSTYLLWALFGGLCVLTMVAVFAMSSRIVKRVLSALRPTAVSTPLTPLRQRPAWLNLRSNAAAHSSL